MNAILIPAYKPDFKLVELTKLLLAHDDLKIVVVDDGSGEAYQNVFSALDARVALISYPVNKGKGGALKTGMEYILAKLPDCERVVTADADGQHKYEDIRKVIRKSEEMPGALVLGSRAFTGNVPFKSRWGNAITRAVFHVASGVRVRDTQTGLRGFDRACMRRFLAVPGDRYEYEINMLLTATRAEIPIHEVEIETVYINDNKGSHFHPFKDAFRIYACIFKFVASSLISFVVDTLMFMLLGLFMNSLLAREIAARVVSGTVNFCLNKNVVFKGNEKTLPAFVKYVCLALIILAVDYGVVSLLSGALGWNELVSKIIAQIVGYSISLPVQGLFVYRRRK